MGQSQQEPRLAACFNAFFKITPDVFELWLSVLMHTCPFVCGGPRGGGSLHAHICSVHEAHVGNCQILRRVPSALLVFAEYQYHKSALANLRAAAHGVGGAEMSQRLVAVGKTKTLLDHVRR